MKRDAIVLGLAFVVFLALAMPVQSLEIVSLYDADGETYGPLEFVDLGTVLINDADADVSLFVEQYMVYPGVEPMPLYEEMTIEAGGDDIISDMSFDVLENTRPGAYIHSVKIHDSVTDELLAEKVSRFYVEGTSDRFEDVSIAVCENPECNSVTSVFVLGETAYFRVASPENPDIEGYVYNNGDPSTLYFSGEGVAEFRPFSAGVYTANVILSKDGFEDEVVEKDITFLETANRPAYFFCDEIEDDVCDVHCPDGEDPDCAKLKETYTSFLVVSVIVVIVMILIGLLLLRMRV